MREEKKSDERGAALWNSSPSLDRSRVGRRTGVALIVVVASIVGVIAAGSIRNHSRPATETPDTAISAPRSNAPALQPTTKVEMIFIKGGKFVMGSPKGEPGRSDTESQHAVFVSDFRLARTEVTNAQYRPYLDENPHVTKPKHWHDGQWNRPTQPVVGISWEQAQAYSRWAKLRLPTEAEWEYATRAGTTTAYYSGDGEADLANVGFYDRNSRDLLHDVGMKRPNAFGLYDLHGNVWEWCSDWFGAYEPALRHDPKGPLTGDRRVARGGSWDDPAKFARSAHRVGYRPHEGFKQVGFRVAADAH
jgi:formylglycine-generating enzyme required for sulfatase activity